MKVSARRVYVCFVTPLGSPTSPPLHYSPLISLLPPSPNPQFFIQITSHHITNNLFLVFIYLGLAGLGLLGEGLLAGLLSLELVDSLHQHPLVLVLVTLHPVKVLLVVVVMVGCVGL